MLYLFGPKETDFINGDSDLIHHTYDEVVDRSKGFYLKFKVALDKDESYKDIKKEMIINAYTPDGWNQFRVFDIYNHTNHVEVVATQLHYDLNYKKVFPFVVNRTTAQTALNVFVQNFKSDLPNFKFTSNINDVHSFSTDDDLERLDEGHNALEILNRIASRWGGELKVDGYNVHLTHKLGEFTNALLYEHKNISEFVDETSMSEIITRIHAVSRFRPEREEGSTEEPQEVVIKVVVDSPLIDEYAQVYEEDYTNNDARTRDQLISWANLKYSTNNIDKPARSIQVETNIIDGQEINYGDDLVLKYTKHDVDEIIRCVGYQYNPNSRQYISVTLGSNLNSLASTITGSVHDSTKNQLSNIEKQVQIIKYASNNSNRVTTGPLPIPDPIEGDMWYYHPDGRPNDVELRIFQDGGWVTIISDMTGENVRRAIADLELEAEGLAEDITASDQKAASALEEAGLAKNAVDAFGIIAQETAEKIVDVEQIAADAKTNAADALAEAGSAVTQAGQAVIDAREAATQASGAVTDASEAKSQASQAVTEAGQALAKARESATNSSGALALAGQAATDSQTAIDTAEEAQTDALTAIDIASLAQTDARTAIDNASTAKTDAQTAIDNAATAQTDAQTAIDNAQTALSTAGNADSKAGQAIAKANAIPGTITDIIADKNLVNGSYVDTKIDGATGAWSQELIKVEGKIDGLQVGGRNYFSANRYVKLVNSNTYRVSASGALNVRGTDNSIGYDIIKTMKIVDLEANTDYVFTFSVPMNDRFEYFDTAGKPLSITSTWNSDYTQFRFTMGSVNGYMGGKFYPLAESYPVDIFVMAEKGNAPTDWSPAPEDLYTQEEFKLFNAKYTQDVTGITGRLTTVESTKLDGSTFETFKQAEYQVTADKVASTITRVDTAEGKITTQGTAISQQATAIASKADKTVVDTLSGTVSNHGTLITQNATDISSKAETEEVNKIKGTVDTHTTEISQNATDIASKASSTSVSNLTGRVKTAETTLTQHATAITSKASQTEVDTVKGTVSGHTTTISQHATAISSKADKSLVDTLSGTVTTQGTAISQNATDIATKANTSTVNTLTGRVDTAESSISQNATAISQRVTTTTYNTGLGTKENSVLKQTTAPAHLNGRLWLDTSVTPNILKRSTGTTWVKATPTTASEVGAYSSSQGSTLAGRVTTAETNITQTSTAITSKADKSVVDTLSGTVGTHTTTLSQHATAISSKAAQTEVDTVKGTVATHTSTLTQQAKDISARLTQSQVDTLVSDKGYSTVNYVDTQINTTAEGIRTEMTAVEGKIPTQIGGRNYFSADKYVQVRAGQSHGNIYRVSDSGALTVRGTDNQTDYENMKILDLEANADYVISFSVPMNDRFAFYDTEGTPLRNTSTMNTDKTQLRFTMGSVDGYIGGKFYPLEQPYPVDVFVMFEKGTVATDWSAPPEDIMKQNDFNTFKASYEQSAQGWSSKLLQIEQADYASKTWSNQTFATPQSVSTQLTSYAKTTDLNGLVTETSLTNKNYITSSAVNTLLGSYAKTTALNGMVTETTLSNKNFITSSAVNTLLSSYAKTTALNGMVTETSLANKSYITSSAVNTLLTSYAKTTALNGLATESYVGTQINTTAQGIRTEMTAIEGKIPTEIGGRNLIKNSDAIHSWVGEHNVTTNAGAFIYRSAAPFVPAMYQIEARAIDDSLVGATLSWEPSSKMQGESIKLSKDWQRVTALLDSSSTIGLMVKGGLGLIELRHIKAERGSVPTDWTPAPEDMMEQADFNTFKASYDQSASGWSAKLLQIEQAGYATQTWSNQTFATPQSVTTQLSSYAKTTALNGMVTETTLATKNFITSSAVNTLLSSYAKTTALNGMVTETTLANKNFATASSVNTLLSSYAKTSALNGMVTETTLANKNFATASSVNTLLTNYAKTTDLNGLATESYVGTQINTTAQGIRTEITAVEGKIDGLEIGGRNYYRVGELRNLFTNSGSNTISSGTQWKSFYIPVTSGEVYSLSRATKDNNRFIFAFTAEEPSDGVPYFGYRSYEDEWVVEGIKVPANAKYMFVYISYNQQVEEFPYIKLEKGSIATDWSPAPEDVVPTEIGGRNLFLNSNKEITSTRFLSFNTYDIVSHLIGQPVTISFDIKLDTGGISRPIRIYRYQGSGIAPDISGYVTPTTEWVRYIFTGTVLNSAVPAGYSLGSVGLHDAAGNNNYIVRRIQVEKGKIATDWTPAPEDMMEQVDFNTFKATYDQSAQGWSSKLLQIEQAGYATKTWSNQTFATPQSVTTQLSSYAKTTALNGMVTETTLATKNFITASAVNTLLASYAKTTALNGMVTETTLANKNFITASSVNTLLSSYAKTTALNGMVTETTLANKNYATASSVTTQLQSYAKTTDLNGLATETYVGSQLSATAGTIRSEITAVENKIPTEIGSRNYFSVENYVKLRTSQGFGSYYRVSDSGALTITGVDGSGGYGTMKMVDLEANTDYVITFSVPMNSRFSYHDTEGNLISIASTWNTDKTQLRFTMGSVDGYIGGKFYPIEQTYPVDVYIMAEKGSVSTDWSAPPEDMATTKQVSEIKQTADSVQALVGTTNESVARAVMTSNLWETEVSKVIDSELEQQYETKLSPVNIVNGKDSNSGETFSGGKYFYYAYNVAVEMSMFTGTAHVFELTMGATQNKGQLVELETRAYGTTEWVNTGVSFNLPTGQYKVVHNFTSATFATSVADYRLVLYNGTNTPVTSIYTLRVYKNQEVQVPVEGTNTGAISTKITQLYDMINMSVLGKEGAMSRIAMGEEGIQIDGKLLHITAKTFIDNAVIKSAMIDTLSATKITTGTLNAQNVNVINLDANSISGKEASFIQAMFTARNSALQITGDGITVSKSNGTRTFEIDSGGAHFYSDTGAGAYITTHNILRWNGSSWVDTGSNSVLFGSELNHSIGIGYKIYEGGRYVTRDAIRLDRTGSGVPELQVNLPIKGIQFTRGSIDGQMGSYVRNEQNNAGIWMGDNGKFVIKEFGSLYGNAHWKNK